MLKPINKHLHKVTIEDIENHKIITDKELDADIQNILKYPADSNRNSFYGNPFLYHFQLKNLLKCRRDKGPTIYEIFGDDEGRDKLLSQTLKKNRGGRTAAGNVYECFRINKGSIVMFKATTAKYLYKKYNAKSVLDPTAGWGGRMLGAWALGIDYIGMDLNTEMSPAYDKMINKLRDTKDTKMDMIFGDCLLQDFSKFNYDMVLTSPPYINMEVYEHMPKWQSDEDYYLKFLIPLWDKCMTNMVSGHVCFNISPKMYEEAVKYGLPISHDEDLLKQQLGQKQNKKKQDKIYIWKK
jgi:hypothetical protein|tara:strand:+ start:607 stop:1494 length:888 start_codon:yes stop_codon:yes gene_type:complete